MAKKSITETGPKALKGIRNPDLYKTPPSYNVFSDELLLQSEKAKSEAAYSSYASYKGEIGKSGWADESVYRPVAAPEMNELGDSTFDPTYVYNASPEDIGEFRAHNQSSITKALAGVTKGAILAGTTFIDGTAGLLAGLGQGIYNAADGDEDTSFAQGFWDNPVTNLMGLINEAAERELVNYRTEEEINLPWYSWDNLTSANFIWDTVVKNMGFTIGAAFSGGVYSKAISWGAKALGMAKLGKASAATIEAGQRAMESARATKATKAIVGSFFSAHAEAILEAYNASLDVIRTSNQSIDARVAEQTRLAVEEFVKKGGTLLDGAPTPDGNPQAFEEFLARLKQIDEASKVAKQEAVKLSKNVGTMDGLLNIPILWTSNLAMFGKMYAGGWESARNANKTITRATKQAVKDAEAAARAGDPSKMYKLEQLVSKAQLTGYQGLSLEEKALVEEVVPHLLGKKTGTALYAVKGPLREGNEEMLQGAASQAAHYRYENKVDEIFDAKLDLDAAHKTRGLLESIGYGLRSQYGDVDNYEEAFVGAITGLLGAPTFGKSNNSTDNTYLGNSKWVGLTDGSFVETRNFWRDRSAADKAAQHATEIMRRENLSDDIKHLIALTHFNDKMDRAIIHDDEKEYKDARTASIFEMITHLKKVGRLDLLQRAMETSTLFTEEDIAEIAESVSKLVSATDPEVLAKTKQKAKVELEILQMLDMYGLLHEEALATGDSSKIDATDDMLEKKRAELAKLDGEINAAKSVTISPYVHKDGTAFTQEEIKQDIDKRVSQFLKIIDTITLALDLIDEATGEALTDDLLTTLTWYKVMMNDWNERAAGITNQWKKVISKLANDPVLVLAIKNLLEVDSLLEEAGFDPSKADVLLGGTFALLKKVRNYYNILQQLLLAVDAGGINLAYLLTSTLKPEGVDSTVGEIINKLFRQVLESDLSISKDVKDAFIKNLDDLESIGKGHRRYNELLNEYLHKPEKIDLAHQESTNRALSEHDKRALARTSNEIDWDASIGSIAQYLKNNAGKISSAGGFAKFIEGLTPELQEKAKKALRLIMGTDSIDDLIDSSGLIDEHASLLRGIIEDKIDEIDNLEDLAAAVKDGILSGELADKILMSIPEDTPQDLIIRLIEAAEVALSEFVDSAFDEASKAAATAEKSFDIEQKRPFKEADKIKETTDEDIAEQATHVKDSDEPTEAPSDNKKEAAEEEVIEFDTTSSTEARKVNKAYKSPEAGDSNYNRRRQVSQYYIKGLDKETLPLHYEEHPEDIPAGVDKDAFLKYIKAVHKKLVDSGAYTYISGVNPNSKLVEGQEIRFTTDAELNEAAGVPVILMVVTDEQGKDQIIGSLPTSLDFQSKKRGSTKTVGEVYPEDKALYEALCDELLSNKDGNKLESVEAIKEALDKLEEEDSKISTITTKVEALMRGMPAFSSDNRSIAEVFGDNSIPLTIIMKKGPKSTKAVTNPVEIIQPINGLVYVYVDSNTGALVPLLCFSTPIKSLSDNDWYIELTVATILKFTNRAKIGTTKYEFLRWMPFLDNLSVNVITNKNGKEYLLFGWGRNSEGKAANSYSIPLLEDGSISTKDAVTFIKSVAKRKILTPSGKMIYPTTNIDRDRINDPEYIGNISRYLKVNVASNSPRTINDWFTYEPTQILRTKKRPDKINPVVPPSNKVVSERSVETPKGTATVSNAGTVEVEGDAELTPAEKAEALAAATEDPLATEVPAAPKSESSEGFSLSNLHGANSRRRFMPDTSPKRGHRLPKKGEAKFSLASSSEDALEQLASRDEVLRNLDKVAAMFPNLAKDGRIVLVKGLMDVVDKYGNPRKAYGMFRNGILYISDLSPKGTAFHEAFHYIADTLLTDAEWETMFKEAAKLWGNLSEMELEENLAESFREFMNEREDHSVKGRLKNIFLKLKHIVISIVGRENYLDNLFWGIYRNRMLNREDTTSRDTFEQELIRYKSEKLKYSNLDQETKDYLKARKFSEENYEKLSIKLKEIVLLCM